MWERSKRWTSKMSSLSTSFGWSEMYTHPKRRVKIELSQEQDLDIVIFYLPLSNKKYDYISVDLTELLSYKEIVYLEKKLFDEEIDEEDPDLLRIGQFIIEKFEPELVKKWFKRKIIEFGKTIKIFIT